MYCCMCLDIRIWEEKVDLDWWFGRAVRICMYLAIYIYIHPESCPTFVLFVYNVHKYIEPLVMCMQKEKYHIVNSAH